MQTKSNIRAQRAAYDWLHALEGRQLILDRTRNGEELVEFMLAVLRGARFRWPELHPKEVGTVPVRPTSQQRVAAATWLAERVWGVAPRVEAGSLEQGGQAELPPPTEAELKLLDAARVVMLEREALEATPDRSVNGLDHSGLDQSQP